MALEFKNVRHESYYIKSRRTKKGNTTYFMTRKKDGTCLESLPNGYEVFEKYDIGTIYIRKIKESNIRQEDLKIIENELKLNESITDYKVAINGDEIIIYVENKEDSNRILEIFEDQFLSKEKLKLLGNQLRRYEEQMKINLKVRKDSREFEIMRYCYKGSIDDWIVIDKGGNIKILAKKNLNHLGKESYYELF